MARITEKQLRRLTSKSGFKVKIVRPTPRWKVGDRKAQKKAKAWDIAIKDKVVE